MDRSRLISTEVAFTQFIEKFRDVQGFVKYEKILSDMIKKGLKSFIVGFRDLNSFDAELASKVLLDPYDLLPHFDAAAFNKLRMCDPKYADKIQKVHVRLNDLPIVTPLSRIGAIHIGKLIMVKGVVVRVSAVMPLLMKAAFRCFSCDETFYMEHIVQSVRMPRACPFCNISGNFRLIPNESVFIDSQHITIQELLMCQLPRQIKVELQGDIVNTVKLGNWVKIVGTVGIRKRQAAGRLLRVFEFLIEANNIEVGDNQQRFYNFNFEFA